MRKYIELTEYGNNGRTVIFADSIQGLCRVWDGECNKEFTEVMVSGYTFVVNEPIDEILERMEKEQSSYNSISTELNGDMISRQAVNEIINDIRDCISVEGYWAFLERLKKLLSVNPTKTGHWIDDGFYAEGHSHKAFHCSGCGYNVLGFKEDLSNYCPNCGTRCSQDRSGVH